MKNKINQTIILVILSIIILLPMVLGDIGDEDNSGCGIWGTGTMNGNYGYFGFIFTWIFSILVIVALVLFIIYMIKKINIRKNFLT